MLISNNFYPYDSELTNNELKDIISNHEYWLEKFKETERINKKFPRLCKIILAWKFFLTPKYKCADFSKKRIQGVTFKNINLEKAIFKEANLVYSAFEHVILKEAIMLGVNLSKARLRDVDLSGANLRGANFNNANLRNVNFQHSILYGVNFMGSTLDFVDIRDAYFESEIFRGVDLNRVKRNKIIDHKWFVVKNYDVFD